MIRTADNTACQKKVLAFRVYKLSAATLSFKHLIGGLQAYNLTCYQNILKVILDHTQVSNGYGPFFEAVLRAQYTGLIKASSLGNDCLVLVYFCILPF